MVRYESVSTIHLDLIDIIVLYGQSLNHLQIEMAEAQNRPASSIHHYDHHHHHQHPTLSPRGHLHIKMCEGRCFYTMRKAGTENVHSLAHLSVLNRDTYSSGREIHANMLPL